MKLLIIPADPSNVVCDLEDASHLMHPLRPSLSHHALRADENQRSASEAWKYVVLSYGWLESVLLAQNLSCSRGKAYHSKLNEIRLPSLSAFYTFSSYKAFIVERSGLLGNHNGSAFAVVKGPSPRSTHWLGPSEDAAAALGHSCGPFFPPWRKVTLVLSAPLLQATYIFMSVCENITKEENIKMISIFCTRFTGWRALLQW